MLSEGTMANRVRQIVKRRQEDWMDEDDLLDREEREQDLRQQLLCGGRGAGAGVGA